VDTLAVAVPNHLGDAVMALPALRRLAAGLPGWRVELRGPEAIVELLLSQGAFGRLASARPSAIVLLAPSFRVAAWASLRAPVRVGLGSDGRGLLLTHRVEDDGTLPSKVNRRRLPALLPRQHQADLYLRIADAALRALGGRQGEGRDGALRWPGRAEPAANVVVDAIGAPGGAAPCSCPSGPYARIVHPFARGLATKRPPPEVWRRVLPCAGRTLVTGGPGREDAACAERVAATLGADVRAGAGAMSLLGWAATAAAVGEVWAPDTGVAHLAAAAGAKVHVLFGPTDPARHAPRGDVELIGPARTPCWPCYRNRCAVPGQPCFGAARDPA
jgi:ADP-heptose:LPS heptosyltransferase